MARPVGIGIQDFEKVITENNFYVDDTQMQEAYVNGY